MIERREVLRTSRVTHIYPNGAAGVEALRDIGLGVVEDEFVCVVGPSGSGKTTLLMLLSGLLQPTRGEIWFEGELLSRPRTRIGFVFQDANLMPWRTTAENIRLPLELQGVSSHQAGEQVQEMVGLVGLAGFERAYPPDLSGGMAQRAALARALVHSPDLLLLDEPFGSLDALSRERMESELLRIWREQQVTVLLVTHSIREAVLLADRVLVLSPRPGRIVMDLQIPLARPRQHEMEHTAEFGELVRAIRGAIG